LLGFWLYEVKALDSGALSPGTVVDDNATGTIEWINPMNATTSDNVYADAFLLDFSPISHYLKATNFGFSIPTDNIITGILVEVEKRGDQDSPYVFIFDNAVRIVKGGVIGITDKSNGSVWSPTDTYISHGSSSDLWGETWTPADINNANFGFAISAKNISATSHRHASVDHIRITVYFQEAASESAKFQVKSGTLEIKSGNLMIQ